MHRPWLTDQESALIGKRGRAADDGVASRALAIRMLDQTLPKSLSNRSSAIAALAKHAGINITRQLAASTLKKGRTYVLDWKKNYTPAAV